MILILVTHPKKKKKKLYLRRDAIGEPVVVAVMRDQSRAHDHVEAKEYD